jgi:hypothetical protein
MALALLGILAALFLMSAQSQTNANSPHTIFGFMLLGFSIWLSLVYYLALRRISAAYRFVAGFEVEIERRVNIQRDANTNSYSAFLETLTENERKIVEAAEKSFSVEAERVYRRDFRGKLLSALSGAAISLVINWVSDPAWQILGHVLGFR